MKQLVSSSDNIIWRWSQSHIKLSIQAQSLMTEVTMVLNVERLHGRHTTAQPLIQVCWLVSNIIPTQITPSDILEIASEYTAPTD